MKLFEHFVQLYQQLYVANDYRDSEIPIHGFSCDVTLAELTEILHCTLRNVKWVLKDMQGKNWIGWKPGLGRGNQSKLTFLRSLEEVILEQIQEHFDSDHWEQAGQIFNMYKDELQGTDIVFKAMANLSPVKKISKGQKSIYALRFISYRQLSYLDPTLISRRTEHHMVRQVFEGLLRYNPTTCYLEPHLALHWETCGEHRVWTFYLRRGVKFHDDKNLYANDIVHSFKRAMNIESPFQWMYRIISKAEALAPDIVQFTLEQSFPNFHHFLAAYPFYITKIPASSNQGLLGTGPFKIREQGGPRLVLDVFDGYFGYQSQLDRVEVYYVPQVFEVTQDKVHSISDEVNFHQYQVDSYKPKNWKAVRSVDIGFKYMVANLGKEGPLQNDSIRQAFFRLLNRRQMINELGGNRHRPAAYVFPERNEAFQQEKDKTSGIENENVKRLKALEKPLSLITYSGAGNVEDAYWVKQVAASYGIELEVLIVPYLDMYSADALSKGDLFIGEQWMTYDPMWTFLCILTQEKSIVKKCLAGTSMFISIMERLKIILTSPDQEQCRKEFNKIEAQLIHEYILFPFYQWEQTAEFPEHVQGASLNDLGWVDYQPIWFKMNHHNPESPT